MMLTCLSGEDFLPSSSDCVIVILRGVRSVTLGVFYLCKTIIIKTIIVRLLFCGGLQVRSNRADKAFFISV